MCDNKNSQRWRVRCVGECVCAGVSACVCVRAGSCVCVCVLVVWEGEKENRDIDREGECRVGRALVSLASRPPPRVCKA